MRPSNQPQVRVRQLSQLLCEQEFLFAKIIDMNDLEELRALFTGVGIGKDSVDVLLINVVVPMKYAFGQTEQAMELLEQIPAENNRIIRQWKILGQKVVNAADSQALIHLYMTYCQQEKCINCDVAYQIFLSQHS